jgi:hypothetical protein
MDLLTLRSGLTTLLSGELGTYTLGNSETTPAISVRAAGDPRPPYKSVSGLEVVIENIPDTTPLRQYDNEELFRTWTVYLIHWDGQDPAVAAAKIAKTYPGTTFDVLQVPPELGPPRQVRVTIPATATYTAS